MGALKCSKHAPLDNARATGDAENDDDAYTHELGKLNQDVT